MWILIVGLIVMVILYSNVSIDAAKNAVELITYNLLPSLFPFFVLTNMLVRSGKIALVSGFLCGYPAGATACANLYKEGTLTKEEALRYSVFTSNAGPTFIVGAVGVGMCASKAIGLFLLAIHFAAALTVAALSFLLIPAKKSTGTGSGHPSNATASLPKQHIPLGTQLTEAITVAMKQIAVVCGYVLFFAVLMSLLQVAGIQNGIVFSLLEITTGMNCLLTPLGSPASMPALLSILPIAAILLGFSGLSIHAQIISILNRAGLPARYFVFGKTAQALLSGFYTWLLLQIPSVYQYLEGSSLAVSASADLLPQTTVLGSPQLLFAELTAALAVGCVSLKKKLKHSPLL